MDIFSLSTTTALPWRMTTRSTDFKPPIFGPRTAGNLRTPIMVKKKKKKNYKYSVSNFFPISIFFSHFLLCSCVHLSLHWLLHFASCTLIQPLVRVTLNVTAVYLCKRTMQNKTRLELADYEAENLARLQKMFSRKWEFIFMQAEAQSKVDKKRDKLERKVLDSQERAFWDVHRPMV